MANANPEVKFSMSISDLDSLRGSISRDYAAIYRALLQHEANQADMDSAQARSYRETLKDELHGLCTRQFQVQNLARFFSMDLMPLEALVATEFKPRTQLIETDTVLSGKRRVKVRYKVESNTPVLVSVHGASGDDINVIERLDDAELANCDAAMRKHFNSNVQVRA